MNALKVAWGIFIVILIACIVVIGILPGDTQVPIHWNSAGDVDKYDSLLIALLMYPGIMLGLLVLIHSIKFLEPRKENLAASTTAKGWIALGVVALLSVMALATIAIAFGYQVPMVRLIILSVMTMLIVVGNFLSKTKSNFFIGIKTPWTLSSEDNWRKTHRLGGRLFMLAGIIGIPLSLILSEDQLSYLTITVVMTATLIPCTYSWYIWHRDNKT
ncbi:SdpI family protein [Colwelliaceae bacterium 6441]